MTTTLSSDRPFVGQVMSIEEVMEATGWSRRSINRRVADGTLTPPVVFRLTPHGTVRFNRRAFMEWLENGGALVPTEASA